MAPGLRAVAGPHRPTSPPLPVSLRGCQRGGRALGREEEGPTSEAEDLSFALLGSEPPVQVEEERGDRVSEACLFLEQAPPLRLQFPHVPAFTPLFRQTFSVAGEVLCREKPGLKGLKERPRDTVPYAGGHWLALARGGGPNSAPSGALCGSRLGCRTQGVWAPSREWSIAPRRAA